MKTKVIERIKAELTPVDLEQRAADTLDECHGPIQIGSLTFDPSTIVRELDPIAFNCMVSDMAYDDGLIEIDGEYYDSSEVEEIENEEEEEEEEEEDND